MSRDPISDCLRETLDLVLLDIEIHTDTVSPDWSLAQALKDPAILRALHHHALTHAHDIPGEGADYESSRNPN